MRETTDELRQRRANPQQLNRPDQSRRNANIDRKEDQNLIIGCGIVSFLGFLLAFLVYLYFQIESISEHPMSFSRRVEDSNYKIKISLSDAYQGQSYEVSVDRQQVCTHCKGTGADQGKVHQCNVCKGSGYQVYVQDFGGFRQKFKTTCEHCHGTGRIIAKPCGHCHGHGIFQDKKTFQINVKRGIQEEDTIVFEQEGNQLPRHIPGSMVFHVNIEKNDEFIRDGNNLHYTQHISLGEALLGFSKTLQHLDGREVRIGRDEVTSPGFEMVMKGEGMPILDTSRYGDLHLHFQVDFPQQLRPDQIEVIENLLPS